MYTWIPGIHIEYYFSLVLLSLVGITTNSITFYGLLGACFCLRNMADILYQGNDVMPGTLVLARNKCWVNCSSYMNEKLYNMIQG